jgi:cytoskeletal protein RodZ
METQAATLGEVLRARRQELGLSLVELAETTRISRSYLRALEEDRLDAFPAEAYRIGFLRTYAGVLGLRLRDLPAQSPALPAEPKLSPLPSADPPRSSGKSMFAVIASVLLVAAAIASASLFRTPQEPLSVAAVPSISGTDVQKLEVFPLSDHAQAGEADARSGDAPRSVDEVHSPESASEILAFEITQAAASSPETQQLQPAASAPVRQQEFLRDEPMVNVIRLRALGPNRLELVLDNRPLQRYELKAETELSWRLRRSALIRIDNPSAVQLWFGDDLLDLGGKSQIILEARPESGGERL